MTWKEGQPKPLGEGWEEINDDEVKEAKVNAIADAGGKEVEAEVSSSVEKEKGDLKRKVLERNESSVMLEEPAKKAKETPSVCFVSPSLSLLSALATFRYCRLRSKTSFSLSMFS